MISDALNVNPLLVAEGGGGEKGVFSTHYTELCLALVTFRFHHLAFSKGLYLFHSNNFESVIL